MPILNLPTTAYHRHGDAELAGSPTHEHHHHHSHSHSHPSRGGAAPLHGHASVTDRQRSAEAHREPLSEGAGHQAILFLDAQSGLAGDMTIAALVDLGVPFSVVEDAVARLGLPGTRVAVQSVWVGALGATRFSVEVEGEQPERSYREIRVMLDRAELAPRVRELAQRVFRRLAEAEAEVHRSEVDEVHFHEVGAVDAIVDIVGAAACLAYLDAEVVCSPLPLGRGYTHCRHGVIPLPAPATVLCLRGIPTIDSGLSAELVTPTGAAIVGALATAAVRWPELTPERVGWGAGTRTLPDRPNALRAVLGKSAARAVASTDTHALLECNVDDMTGEELGYVIERLLEVGALDAWAQPVTMKKGRPAWTLSAICRREVADGVAESLLRESSSIGLRRSLVSRVELPRTMLEVSTPWGAVPVKVSGTQSAGTLHVKPELDVCKRLAAEYRVSLREVLAVATETARAQFVK